MPKLTTPVRTACPFFSQINGPPESPWQESLPPSSSPAQIMELVIPPYCWLHFSLVIVGTATHWRFSGKLLAPDSRVPHPLTKHVSPVWSGANEASGKQAAPTSSLKVKADANFKMTKSLLLPWYGISAFQTPLAMATVCPDELLRPVAPAMTK